MVSPGAQLGIKVCLPFAVYARGSVVVLSPEIPLAVHCWFHTNIPLARLYRTACKQLVPANQMTSMYQNLLATKCWKLACSCLFPQVSAPCAH
jgi:hypothetical protein